MMMRKAITFVMIVLIVLFASHQATVVSHGTAAVGGNGDSGRVVISGDGRYVAFWSWASNLVAGDTNEVTDLFLYDRQTGAMTNITIATGGGPERDITDTVAPLSLSDDGRFLVFYTYMDHIVPEDKNGETDVYLYDGQTKVLSRVSVAPDGSPLTFGAAGGSVSGDGRFILFSSEANNLVHGDTNDAWDVFLRERESGRLARVSVSNDGEQGNGRSGQGLLSRDGRFVVFYSEASNLVSGDTNGLADYFIHDLVSGETRKLALPSDYGGIYPMMLSGDGSLLAFQSTDATLVPNDTNDLPDVFVHRIAPGETRRVSVATDGTQSLGRNEKPALSGDGRYVAFVSYGMELAVEGDCPLLIYIHDLEAGETDCVFPRIRQSQEVAQSLSISWDGRYVAYSTWTDNTAGQYGYLDHQQVFVYDRQTGELSLVTTGIAEEQ